MEFDIKKYKKNRLVMLIPKMYNSLILVLLIKGYEPEEFALFSKKGKTALKFYKIYNKNYITA